MQSNLHTPSGASSRSLWAAIALSIGCVVPILGLPIIVEGLEDHWHLSAQAGYITALDLAGTVLGSTLTSSLALKIHWRGYLTGALLVAALANIACALHPAPLPLAALRFLAGLASGGGYASSLTLLSRQPDTARAFSWMIFAQVVANALILALFPLLDAVAGPAGMFGATGGLLALTLVVAPLMPGRSAAPAAVERATAPLARGSVLGLAALCLTAIAFVYVAIGSYWAYAERMGVTVGLAPAAVHRLLSAGVLLSALGCLAAFRLSRRHGQSRPLLGALAALAAVLIADGLWQSAVMYVFTLGTLQLCWNFIDIYQLGTLSMVDPSGRSAALVPAAQGVALALGPAAANLTLNLGGGYTSVLLMAGSSALLAVACYACVHLRHERLVSH